MKNFFIWFAISFVTVLSVGFYIEINKEVSKSHPVVLLTVPDTEFISSAVHIGNGYFFTTNHSLVDTNTVEFLAQGSDEPVIANVLWTSKRYDIAYLYAPDLADIDYYPLSCDEFYIGQKLEFHGNPAGLTSITTTGYVAGEPFDPDNDVWELVVPVDSTIIPGMSGGSATYFGELVGINVGTLVYNIGFAGSFTGISYIVPNTVLCELIAK